MSGRVVAPAVLAALVGLAAAVPQAAQRALPTRVDGNPDAIVDLRTSAGLATVAGTWRYRDAAIAPVSFRAVAADLTPTGPPVMTHELRPHPGADFDGQGWLTIPPDSLDRRRGNGRLSFGWYRLTFEVPARLGAVDARGATLVFEIVVDDYAEVVVNGRLARVLGQSGGSVVRGFNAPNRVVLTRDAVPGQRFDVAVLGVNGPLSDLPANYIWVRSATIDVYGQRHEASGASTESFGRITRRDAALDRIVSPTARIEKLADGFQFTEGPVWAPDGYLLFSDPNANTIYRWSEDAGVSVFRVKSGYSGLDVGRYRQPGSNGLAFDGEGRLAVAQHGERRVVRIERNGQVTVLADRYLDKRLNSPNDLVYRSDGSLYFTDPPFGLPNAFNDPAKEQSFSGVYRWHAGAVQLLTTDLTGPNGLAFSPDERTLYVGNWDEARKVVMQYDVTPAGTLANGRVFLDLTSMPGEDAIDGVKVDERGNVYVSGPGGVWIASAEGTILGTLVGAEHPHNMAWGDADRRTLYLTAQTGVYRVRLDVAGARPPSPVTR